MPDCFARWLMLPALLVLGASLPSQPPPSADNDTPDFVSLFNGRNLEGWIGDPKYWTVADGLLTGKTTADNQLEHNTFLIWQGGKPSDFELHLKYRIVGGNSGIQYRSQVVDADRYVVAGYQADIDSSPRFTGMNYEERGREFLAQRGQKVEILPDGTKKVIGSLGDPADLQRHVRDQQWNTYRIVAQGRVLKHFVNGVQMSEVIDNQQDQGARSGVMALQLHQGPPMTVQFKELRLKALP